MNPSEYRKSLEDYYAMQKAHEKEVEELQHWGLKGMKWGRRRYQNEDGSLTEEGRKRYGVGDPREKLNLKMEAERLKEKLNFKRNKDEAKLQMKMDRAAAKNDAIRIKAEQYGKVQEAREETKQKKLGMQPEVMAEKTEKRNSSLGRKVVIAGIATVAAVGIIHALKSRSGSAEVKERASKGAEVLKNNEKVKETLGKSVSAVAKSNASKGVTLDSVMSELNAMDPKKFIKGSLAPNTYSGFFGRMYGTVKAAKEGAFELKQSDLSDSTVRVRRIPKEVADHVIT